MGLNEPSLALQQPGQRSVEIKWWPDTKPSRANRDETMGFFTLIYFSIFVSHLPTHL